MNLAHVQIEHAEGRRVDTTNTVKQRLQSTLQKHNFAENYRPREIV
jgi:hypothetical protein